MPKTVEVELPTYGNGMMGTASMNLSEECYTCIHLKRDMPLKCKAFPEGIPADIGSGRVSHTKSYEGDNGILFQKRIYKEV